MLLFFVYYFGGEILAKSKKVETKISIEEYEKSNDLIEEIENLKKNLLMEHGFDDCEMFDNYFIFDYWIF